MKQNLIRRMCIISALFLMGLAELFSQPQVSEYPVINIPLEGPLSSRKAEISGLTWYGDQLVVLPQYPHRFGMNLFFIPRDEIVASIESPQPLAVHPTPFSIELPDVKTLFPGYEGLESIVFSGDTVFITIEAETEKGIAAFLIRGIISLSDNVIKMDTRHAVMISPQTGISNFSEEAMILTPEGPATIYEANGKDLNPSPVMHRVRHWPDKVEEIPFPHMEYRITDATTMDSENRFWVLNYLWPGDAGDLVTGADPLFERFGKGKTHFVSQAVERIVELQWSPEGIRITAEPPVLLELLDDDSRNWEGIVRLDHLGFIIATDKFPQTILAFVPYPPE